MPLGRGGCARARLPVRQQLDSLDQLLAYRAQLYQRIAHLDCLVLRLQLLLNRTRPVLACFSCLLSLATYATT